MARIPSSHRSPVRQAVGGPELLGGPVSALEGERPVRLRLDELKLLGSSSADFISAAASSRRRDITPLRSCSSHLKTQREWNISSV